MIKRKFSIWCSVLVGSIISSGCIEEFEPETVTFESALVVEATITNELGRQQVFLSRTFEFEADGPESESNASVEVVDDMGNVYSFVETEAGVYNSANDFRAEEGRSYMLNVRTNDGRAYSSSSTSLPAATQLDNVYAERITTDLGEEGIAIYADSFDPSGMAQNYRYTYEETYKIIAPRWIPEDLEGDPMGGCGVIVVQRENDEETCFRTDVSTDIIQIDTNGFEEDRVSRFLVRFISRDNYIISHRYSILVKQLVQSNESYSFYETLNEFSGSESLFSETQPGFLQGNVSSNESAQEKVLGYFDVATVDEQRIFFNYDDFFPDEDLPPYVNPCQETAPLLSNPGGCILRPIVEANTIRLVAENSSPGANEGPYLVVPRVCGDCTVLGSTEVPDFWTE